MRSVLQRRFLVEEGRYVRRWVESSARWYGDDSLHAAVCHSEPIREVLTRAAMAAQGNERVLLLGEQGVGKKTMARWIHQRSKQAAGPFFCVDCASFSSDLLETQIVGSKPGTSTGTSRRWRGSLELASGGTLLLTKVGALHVDLQAKVLRWQNSKTMARLSHSRCKKPIGILGRCGLLETDLPQALPENHCVFLWLMPAVEIFGTIFPNEIPGTSAIGQLGPELKAQSRRLIAAMGPTARMAQARRNWT